MPFATPQDAEDAFYDALEAGNAEAMAQVWEPSTEIACLLPMTPLLRGPAVLDLWRGLFAQGAAFDVEVQHLGWIETADLAVHLVEERVAAATGPDPGRPKEPAPVVYGTNLFRRGTEGWYLVLHQNSPAPPPPGTALPGTTRN